MWMQVGGCWVQEGGEQSIKGHKRENRSIEHPVQPLARDERQPSTRLLHDCFSKMRGLTWSQANAPQGGHRATKTPLRLARRPEMPKTAVFQLQPW